MLPLAIGLFCPSCLEKTYLPSTWIGPGHLPCVAEAPGAGRSPRGQWCVSISRLPLSVARQWVWENREVVEGMGREHLLGSSPFWNKALGVQRWERDGLT